MVTPTESGPKPPRCLVPKGRTWVALLLAAIAFVAYWPSLQSDFVYDTRIEILNEGFITHLSNLPAVLELKTLHTGLMLGPRPGQMIYLMLIAAVAGQEPFGYHLCSNLLHAANVALLFILLGRLLAAERLVSTKGATLTAQVAAATITLIFALHPIATETVANVGYSSDLLVTFFTLLALLAAISFRPENRRKAILAGSAAALCALAAVTCKESGIAVAPLLVVYWLLFRRDEPKGPWLVFLGTANVLAAAFLVMRFLWNPPPLPFTFLVNSLSDLLSIQPRLWVFMLGQMIWPAQLSADYVIYDVGGISTTGAVLVLVVVVLFQGWLAWKSRTGALGVAMFWLGLAAVSNFVPLYRPLADRYYYLPMAGLALQLVAVLLLVLKFRPIFWAAIILCLVALVPLTRLTLIRENVFASDFALWTDTVRASPGSAFAYTNLGTTMGDEGRTDEAIPLFLKALKIDPTQAEEYFDLGWTFAQKGQMDRAIPEYQMALERNPNYLEAHTNLGIALFQTGRIGESVVEFEKSLELKPGDPQLQENLDRAKAGLRSSTNHQ